YDQVLSKLNLLGQTIESLQAKPDDQLRQIFIQLRDALPNAMITSYTHKPLIGMNSETDPSGRTSYYKYDNFGRLESILNRDENILKRFKYNYGSQ
ncbi:MAG: RHS repeat domain-containing protein, partial [Bacteroidales bacterium]|nr:RHS repeat domain-containing protein [Bacteroidales bacterium]